MRVRTQHRALLAATTAVLALGLTACNGSDKAAPAPAGQTTPTAGQQADASAPATTGGGAAAQSGGSSETPVKTPASAGAAGKTTGGTGTGSGTGSGTSKGSGTAKTGNSSKNTEEYAYKHPCAMTNLTVNVRQGGGSLRVIEVTNKGATACGLDLLPAVDLGLSTSADRSGNIHPLVPSGIGGPDHALLVGTKAYAVLDLAGKAGGTGKKVDEINVLVSPSHMPNADTRNFPIGAGARVAVPKLGLYRDNVADATASMKQADITQS
ncbi:DUF4232 domain-containing protein [Streptomyces termitum]|uniref:DUF4232 domain-containing protein n=1 Tax=Streptomyces termitum TaxID=67368 RepID=UPI0033B04B75